MGVGILDKERKVNINKVCGCESSIHADATIDTAFSIKNLIPVLSSASMAETG